MVAIADDEREDTLAIVCGGMLEQTLLTLQGALLRVE
jgi:hypothetical protein